jgi:hypothetical protein
MRRRLLALLGGAAVIAVVSLVSVAAQTPTTAAKPAKPGPAPKTSWGEPDLQGLWTSELQIPLQRPAKYAGREFLTDAEVAELDKVRATLSSFGDRRGEPGTEVDVAGAYNSVFTSRKHTGRRTSMVVDPPDGRVPPLTPAVQQRNQELREFMLAHLEATEACKSKLPGCEGGKYTGVASPRMREPYQYYPGMVILNRADGPEDHNLGMRCLSAQLPDFGGFRQIVQSPGAVSIFYDTGQGQGWHRTIPVDGSPHPPSSVRLWWGDSRGHWEGNTLVIDVTNFSGKTNFRGSTDNLHLIERWTRTDRDTLEYVVTFDDPTTWTKPWTAKQEWAKQGDQFNRIYKEPRCVEGNYSIFGWLAGARAKDQAFAEGRGPDPATINYATETNSAVILARQSGDEEADPLAE